MLWQHYYQPTTLAEALALLDTHAGNARIVAGGTDVIVELQRGVNPTSALIDITRIAELKYIRHDGDYLALGALTTHNDVISSGDCVRDALPLAQACAEVGAPQIRTRATVAGNLVTASPANDTIAPLLALNTELVISSLAGERIVPLSAFYPGFRQRDLRPGELVREIRIPTLKDGQRGLFIKLGLRRAQAISVIDLALVVTLEHEHVSDARIAIGCVAPTVVRMPETEAFLHGKPLDQQTCATAGKIAAHEIRPIDDIRGTAVYRIATVEQLVADGLRRLAEGREREGWPTHPVLLETTALAPVSAEGSEALLQIQTTINGQAYTLAVEPASSLLDALRDNAGLTGTKEGCAEGECGACTVWLNGQAVMSCLVPAPQAHGAQITTIEGLANGLPDAPSDPSQPPFSPPASLHPLQAAFIRKAAVQCGYCIPGMLMAGAKLLDEVEQPSEEQIQAALSGNICRCTGYRKILDAVLDAANQRRDA